MVRLVTLALVAALALAMNTNPAASKCASWQTATCPKVETPAPGKSWRITNKHRQRVGDIYNSGHRRRLKSGTTAGKFSATSSRTGP